jgi:hypothetical protein
VLPVDRSCIVSAGSSGIVWSCQRGIKSASRQPTPRRPGGRPGSRHIDSPPTSCRKRFLRHSGTVGTGLRSVVGSFQLPVAAIGALLTAFAVEGLLTLPSAPEGEGFPEELAVLFLYAVGLVGFTTFATGLAIRRATGSASRSGGGNDSSWRPGRGRRCAHSWFPSPRSGSCSPLRRARARCRSTSGACSTCWAGCQSPPRWRGGAPRRCARSRREPLKVAGCRPVGMTGVLLAGRGVAP